jgi:hypothetical protein
VKIVDTFITIADDSNAVMGRVPPAKDGDRTIARLHYDLLSEHPYEFDLDSFNFEVYCLKNHIAPEHRDAHRAEFFAKGHPCMRASPLTKTYGFGAHYDGAGRIAIYPVDSKAYAKFLSDGDIKKEPAMRSKRPSAEAAGVDPDTRHHPVKPAA